jgi:hypothetical protein
MLQARRFAILPLLLIAIGCNSGEPTTKVTGLVSYKGAPLPSGLINFFPATGGRPIGQTIGSDGKYAIELPPGDYTVVVLASNPPVPAGWKEGDPLPKPEVTIPAKYGLPTSSPLQVSIPEAKSFEHDVPLD